MPERTGRPAADARAQNGAQKDKALTNQGFVFYNLEARAGVEPAWTALQAAA